MADHNLAFVGANVAIIEDDPLVTRLVTRWLVRAGAHAIGYGLGERGLQAITSSPPDLLLLDMNLPDVDGFVICERIRATPNLAGLPILMMTGYHDAALLVRAFQAGVDDYVEKPVGREVLLARGGNLLRRARAEAESARLLAKLTRYVSSAALEQAVHVRPQETIEAAVLFSDVRNFTRTSFDANLDEIFAAINLVLSHQSTIVGEHEGYVDKFSGDGLLAVFPGRRGSENACDAARAIVQWAQLPNVGLRYWSPLPIGLGIHFGPIARGDIGDDKRREYTVIGHTVNLAARLCGVARPLEVVVTEEVVERAGAGVTVADRRELGFKGVPTPTAVYSLLPRRT